MFSKRLMKPIFRQLDIMNFEEKILLGGQNYQ